MRVCLYIYIYICLYCHPQIDCFVVSQFISVARHVGRLKLESKPAQIYVRLSIRPLKQQAYHVSFRIIRYYVVAFVCLHFIPYWIPETSIRSKRFALCKRQPYIPSPESSTPMGELIYINSIDSLNLRALDEISTHPKFQTPGIFLLAVNLWNTLSHT